MPLPIEDYGLIGDTHGSALVGRDGSIDWLCVPRFDADPCFAALLGEPRHGRWLLAPAVAAQRVQRRYRDGTLILETDFETAGGAVRVVDFMPVAGRHCHVVRIVEGLRGRVPMQMELVIRFDFGSIVPWVRRAEHGLLATAGPDTLALNTEVETHGKDFTTVAGFEVAAGDSIPFVLSYHASHEPGQAPPDARRALAATETWWHDWSERCTLEGPWREAVLRSLITLKALTYSPTGGIVAAPTTSLPEQPGGVRNWDYRYCWLRDATFTLYALLSNGYRHEAAAWREWLLRAAAGSPQDLHILYGIAGERHPREFVIDWLPGYFGAAPVRVGNAAAAQFQLDVYGEIMEALDLARMVGLPPQAEAWNIQKAFLKFVESHWQRPDNGIWEMRGPPRQFTHSKLMAWVAFDRGIKSVERAGLDGPVERWRELRNAIREDIVRHGFDAGRNTFVQFYGGHDLDASLLMIPLVGFLPVEDPRVRGTVEAIRSTLMRDGLVQRYSTAREIDGLPPGEGAFLPCSLWLVDNLALLGRHAEAQRLFEHVLALRNDLGLLSEEYDPVRGCMLGNFPQALTHVALINSARYLAGSVAATPGEPSRAANAMSNSR